jgi:hypothetical protein
MVLVSWLVQLGRICIVVTVKLTMRSAEQLCGLEDHLDDVLVAKRSGSCYGAAINVKDIHVVSFLKTISLLHLGSGEKSFDAIPKALLRGRGVLELVVV